MLHHVSTVGIFDHRNATSLQNGNDLNRFPRGKMKVALSCKRRGEKGMCRETTTLNDNTNGRCSGWGYRGGSGGPWGGVTAVHLVGISREVGKAIAHSGGGGMLGGRRWMVVVGGGGGGGRGLRLLCASSAASQVYAGARGDGN